MQSLALLGDTKIPNLKEGSALGLAWAGVDIAKRLKIFGNGEIMNQADPDWPGTVEARGNAAGSDSVQRQAIVSATALAQRDARSPASMRSRTLFGALTGAYYKYSEVDNGKLPE